MGTLVVAVRERFANRQRMGLQFPIPANHVWPLSYEPSAGHSPCSPLTPITADDSEQLKSLGSMSVPTKISGSLAAVLNDRQMRLFCGSQSHLQRKARYYWQQESHFALPNICSPSVCERSYKPSMTGNWDYNRTGSRST